MASGPACAGWIALWWVCEPWRPWHLELAQPPWLLLPWQLVAGVACFLLPWLLCFWLRTRSEDR